MNEDQAHNFPDNKQVSQPPDGFTFHWIQLMIGAVICYLWFYESWTSILFLALAVVIHELGHVIIGKAFGCFIQELQVFLLCFVSYKPRQVPGGSSWRNITWSLGTLPLGGFTMFKTRPKVTANEDSDEEMTDDTVVVEICDDATADDEAVDAEEFMFDSKQAAASPYIDDKPAWQRLLISAGGVLFNFVTFIVLYIALPLLPVEWSPALRPLMVLSLILAVLNILPVYPLDGGSIIFACYEMITGKKPSQQFVNTCGMLGFIFIVLFFWIFPDWIRGLLSSVFGVFF